MQKIFLPAFFILIFGSVFSQPITFPVNGVHDDRPVRYAIKNANIVIPEGDTIRSGIILVYRNKIEDIGIDIKIPEGTVVLDIDGKWVFPSFIESSSNYGIPTKQKQPKKNKPQFESDKQGAFSWNQALNPESRAYELFVTHPDSGIKLRKAGFGTAITFNHDGIARGSAAAVLLTSGKENELIISKEVAACYL